jgi:hypothetical protein
MPYGQRLDRALAAVEQEPSLGRIKPFRVLDEA